MIASQISPQLQEDTTSVLWCWHLIQSLKLLESESSKLWENVAGKTQKGL